MNTKLVSDETYQLLTRRAIQDERWAAYFLLVNTCYVIAKEIPITWEEMEGVDIEKLLIHALEQIGMAIYKVLPGGLDEFYHYMPQPQRNTTSQ